MLMAFLPSAVLAQAAVPPVLPSAPPFEAAAPAPAQSAPEEETEIVVTGQRPRGSVVGDIQPELTLSPADIRSRGVSNIADLIADLGPQVTSGRGGQPVVLLEGRRISGFREVATLPTEAIARVEILPEEVALKYGYPADQKVVNIVLRQRFRAFTLEADARLATAGGGFQGEGEFDFLRISKAGRINLHIEQQTTEPLFESQRGIDVAGQGPYRSLIAEQRDLTATATLNRTIAGDISATLNGELKTSETTDNFGLVSLLVPVDAYDPLTRAGSTQSAHAGTTLNGNLGAWRWTFTGNYDHVETKALTDRVLDANLRPQPVDQARSTSDIAAVDFVVNGSPFRLPAGEASLTVKAGSSFSGFRSRSVRAGFAQAGQVSRDIANAQVNVDLPVASRREGVLEFIGDLSVNGNFAVNRLSDFGTLTTWGAGANWSPIKAFSLIGSFTRDDAAPSSQQLGNAVIVTPNVRVFDFVRGTNATVTLTTGGNPNLQSSTRDVFRLGARLKPIEADLTLTADFTQTRVSNAISSLPPASLASQLAFPGRFIRNGGDLIAVDSRAVNFAETRTTQLRTGINFSKPLKTSQAQLDALRAAFQSRFPGGPPGGRGDRPAGERGPGAGGGGGGGRGGFGGQGGGGGRLNFAAYHTVYFEDRVTFAAGQPSIDLLSGGTISGGGRSRHEVELQAGYNKGAIGGRLTANWQSATRVSGLTAAQNLRFSDLATANLRLFFNPGSLPSVIKSQPWLRGVRVTLGVNNILNTRQRVTDGIGGTPVAYLPGYLDPLGRTIRISVRKLLF